MAFPTSHLGRATYRDGFLVIPQIRHKDHRISHNRSNDLGVIGRDLGSAVLLEAAAAQLQKLIDRTGKLATTKCKMLVQRRQRTWWIGFGGGFLGPRSMATAWEIEFEG